MFYDDGEAANEQSIQFLVKELLAAFEKERPKTAAKAARCAHHVLCRIAKSWGYNPDIEVFMADRERTKSLRGSDGYCVCWESGPYEWSASASMALTVATGHCVEAYYSFDLMFYPGEWEGSR